MTPERFQQIGELYHAALELPPEDRVVFLKQACNGDLTLLREVENLLASNDQAGSFLATPIREAAAELLIEDQTTALIGRRLGRYRILSRLGAGGMGEVYLAEDEKLDRRVALKLLPAEFAASPDRLHRFELEAKAASATDHPNIVTIHEIGETDGIHFIAEEYVEGETLRRHIQRAVTSLPDALDIALQVADALAAAHGAGIIHRDIKPENIMLRPDGYVKVLDFGLASAPTPPSSNYSSNLPTVPAETSPGTILGTVSYMSPEQTRGQKADARSDLWSLGVVLYEMLTQRQPFLGESVPDIFVAILDRDPPPLHHSMAAPPPELEHLLAKLLAKDRERRYASAGQLAADLKKFHHRLELEAERRATELREPATLLLSPRAVTAEQQSPASSAEPLPPAPVLSQSQNEPVTKELAKVARLSWATIALVIFLLVTMVAVVVWGTLSQKPPVQTPSTAELQPERSLQYSLTVQRMREGLEYQAPFEATGREIFESGWKFRLNLSSPQNGSLYIINEGPAASGGITYQMVFPFPTLNGASAQMPANQMIQTGWFHFNQYAGTEKLWLVWAAQPVDELEAVKPLVNPRDLGVISDPNQLTAVRALLNKYGQGKPKVDEDRIKKQVTVKDRARILVTQIDLEHK